MSFVASCLLSVIRKQWLEQYSNSDVQSSLMTGSGQILCHQYGISVTESQTFLFAKCTPAAMSKEKRLFSKAIKGLATKHIASEQALQGALVVGREKERELGTTSLKFEYLH